MFQSIQRRLLGTVVPAVLAVLAPSGSLAQVTAIDKAYLEGHVPKAPEAITTLGPDMFGDKVNLFNSSFSFEQTDVSLPGNNALPVALIRSHQPGRFWNIRGSMADWDVETPRIQGTFADVEGWVPWGGTGAQRCSGFQAPPGVTRSGHDQSSGQFTNVSFQPHEYWSGTQLVVPGHGSQEILQRNAAFTAAPAGDVLTYGLVTTQLWQIRCLDGAPNAAGQGFVAVAPDGTQYRFDWMATRAQISVRKAVDLGRIDMFLMATRVTDRFGNYVDYTYDSANRMNLLSIQSSDGRLITLTYSGGRVATVSDQTRTWTYAYHANGDLQSVTLPDGAAWQFNLRPMVPTSEPYIEYADCDTVGQPPYWWGIWPAQPTGWMKHPSGAEARFETGFRYNFRSDVPRACTTVPGTTWEASAVYSHSPFNQGLFKKTISGPGMADQVWQYSVQVPNWTGVGTWGPCGSGCGDRKIVVVTEPDGTVNRHTFGIRWQANEGQLLQLEEGWNGTSALRTTTYSYRSAAGQNFPDRFGNSLLFTSDYLSSRNRPQDATVITQQGVDFSRIVDPTPAGFNGFAQPLKVTKQSTLGYTVTADTAYHDNLAKWVIGQVASVTEAGVLRQQTDFHATTAMPTARYEFGRLLESISYHSDGSVYQRLDPLGRPNTYTDYWRGIPRHITWRDGAVQTAQVNNYGRITHYTNAAGTTTQYGYDAMGRLASITYPSEGWGPYHPTNITFGQASAMEFGIPAGHWQQTITTGNLRTTRYFDAMWREGLSHTRDLSDVAGTSSFVISRYDPDGRKTFESQPQRSINGIGDNVPGKTWWYDGLGRPIAQREDSELGALNTTTVYGSDFRRHVTNPRGYTTTTAFQAFDVPSEDAPSLILAVSEAVAVTIARDVFGKATAITREGGGKSASRSYVYDAHQRLCKTVERETGATLQAYDGAGNLAWRASGQPFTGTAPGVCEQGQVPGASKISFGYDARNRLTSTAFGDGSPSITRAYTGDGLLQQIITHHTGNPITWNYRYNNRRLLEREQYAWWTGSIGADEGWLFHHGIEPHGNVSSLSDASGTLHYTPNALGQPRQVSGYASGVTYHPNGAVAGYTLANGMVHSTELNERGLPRRWRYSGISNDRYQYDGNGNVAAIVDEHSGANTRAMPWYDGLDRLRQANGPWGSATYGYDALDNLVSSTVGSRTLEHYIDPATNRLTEFRGGQSLFFGYDANGNLTSRGAQTFHFDIGNRMTSAPGKVNYYLYDGHGRRNLVWFADGNWMHQAYTLDGKLRRGWRNTEGATRHVYLGDKLIAETSDAGVTTYAYADALGSPITRNGANGIVSREPYGAKVAGTTSPTKIGFTGHVDDADTGLVYMQQRYYDPIAGRFLSVDPVTTDLSTGALFNRYEYANNNPYAFVDPDGRQAACTATRIGGGCPSGGGIAFSASGSSIGFGDAGSPESNRQGLSNTRADQEFVQGAKALGVEAASALPPLRVLRFGLAAKGVGEASSLANAARLRGQLAGKEIAGGHAFEKHVLNQGEFKGLGIRTREQFANHIENVVNNPTASRQLSGGRSAYWQESTGTVVIRNPRAADGGTAFQPTNGRAYFDGLR